MLPSSEANPSARFSFMRAAHTPQRFTTETMRETIALFHAVAHIAISRPVFRAAL